MHYLRDALLAVPGFVLAALVATLVAYRLCRGLGDGGECLRARLGLPPPPGSTSGPVHSAPAASLSRRNVALAI